MINGKRGKLNLPNLILASGSPRRAEILTAVGWNFTKDVADVDESEIAGELPEDYVRRLAREKAETVAAKYENAVILGADTTVVVENQILGKPTDLADARRMLRMLSGVWHEVLTGVAIVKKGENEGQVNGKTNRKLKIGNPTSAVGLQKTRVKFAAMSETEINFLVENGAPLDKAGAYAVQAQAALFIEKIEGDYWNVVGLPVNLIYEMLSGAE